MQDSRPETYKHIQAVQQNLNRLVKDLIDRGVAHDRSKLEFPEVCAFDKVVGRLVGMTYGSDEYRAALREIKPALQHHYMMNRHHPEHHQDGIKGMTLVDLMEMVCDWEAASHRHDDGDVRQSIRTNQERFGYSDDLRQIMLNTVDLLDGKADGGAE